MLSDGKEVTIKSYAWLSVRFDEKKVVRLRFIDANKPKLLKRYFHLSSYFQQNALLTHSTVPFFNLITPLDRSAPVIACIKV